MERIRANGDRERGRRKALAQRAKGEVQKRGDRKINSSISYCARRRELDRRIKLVLQPWRGGKRNILGIKEGLKKKKNLFSEERSERSPRPAGARNLANARKKKKTIGLPQGSESRGNSSSR